MDARITKEETALLLNLAPSRRARDVEAIRLAAIRARDQALGQAIARGLTAVYRGIRAAIVFLANYPQRRAVFDQLRGMSDRELADIGLERADLARVFDEDFAVGPSVSRRQAVTTQPAPANSNVTQPLQAAA